MAILITISSNEKKDVLLGRIVKKMKENGLDGLTETIQTKLIDEKESTYQFRLIGKQANMILQQYQKVIVNPILDYFEENGLTLSSLLSLKLQAFSFCCQKLREMSSQWEVLKYKKVSLDEDEREERKMPNEEVEGCLEEMAQQGRDVPKSNITPWLFTLCIDCPYFATTLYSEYGVGLGASSCQAGELRNLFQKWWIKKCGHSTTKFERAALYDDLFFLTALLCPVMFSIRNSSIRSQISYVAEGKCHCCGVNKVVVVFGPQPENPPDSICSYCKGVHGLMKKAFTVGLEEEIHQVLCETLCKPTPKPKQNKQPQTTINSTPTKSRKRKRNTNQAINQNKTKQPTKQPPKRPPKQPNKQNKTKQQTKWSPKQPLKQPNNQNKTKQLAKQSTNQKIKPTKRPQRVRR